MISCGEIGAEASVASPLPAIFGLARVDIDQMAATAATATMPPIMMILRIPHHLRVVRNCAMHWHIIGGVRVRYLTQAEFRPWNLAVSAETCRQGAPRAGAVAASGQKVYIDAIPVGIRGQQHEH